MCSAVALSGGAAAGPAVARPMPTVRPVQELVTVLTAHRAVATLGRGSSRATGVRPYRPLTGAPTVLPVLGHATSAAGRRWLRVLLPGRPNGAGGWIAERGTELTRTSWQVIVRTARRRVLVYRRGHLVRSFAAIVGKPSTPTPHGRFFVEESVRMPSMSAGAPFALALSARSNVLQEFEGGPGQIAIHGVANLGGTPGTAISHGCIRLANHKVRWMAAHIHSGVRVDIVS